MKERYISYDYIRIVAMLLVIACHSFGDVSSASPAIISMLSYIEMPCNGLFFAVSGALLLPVSAPPHQSKSWLISRLKKILIPTLLWSLVYLVIERNISIITMLSIPFSPQGASILWFMYTLIGLYIIAPIISLWLEKVDKKTLQLYLLMWSISLCYPILSNWININESITGPIYYLSGFGGYFVLGYYLKRFTVNLKISCVMYVIAFLVMILDKLFVPDIILYKGLWNLTIFCAISVIFYWNILSFISTRIKLSKNNKSFLITTSNLIFGVYFIHYGILNYVIPQIGMIPVYPYLLGYFIRIVIAFCGSLLISWLISHIPFSYYIIGYKHK